MNEVRLALIKSREWVRAEPSPKVSRIIKFTGKINLSYRDGQSGVESPREDQTSKVSSIYLRCGRSNIVRSWDGSLVRRPYITGNTSLTIDTWQKLRPFANTIFFVYS